MMKRKGIQAALLAGLLAAVALWSGGVMMGARHRAIEAKQGLEGVQRCALAIEALRDRPTLAADRERLDGEMAGLIEKQASSLGMSRPARISPEPPQRVGESSYKEKPTQVALRGVTIEQAVRFVHALCAADAALNVKSLRLTPPSVDNPAGKWSADVVLTYLIYSPRNSE